MSKDIRSFFSVISKKPEQNKTSNKKRANVRDSSDYDVIESSPVPTKSKLTLKSKKRKFGSDSDEETKKKKAKTTNASGSDVKIRKVEPANVFGITPVKQTKIEKKEIQANNNGTEKKSPNKTENKSKTKPVLKTELGIHDDPDFEKSLLELDNDLLLDNVNVLDKTLEKAINDTNTSMISIKKTPKHKGKVEDDEYSEIDKDQEKYEKRRHSALLYQKYLNRSGPIHHGAKEYPKGKPDCFKGLCFLRTGVLDSLADEEFQTLIKDHGGRTVHAVSKKVNYVVVGVDAGPAKLEKASSYGIPNISEDELLDLILTKSGMAPKYAKGEHSNEEYDKTQSTNSEKTKKLSPKEFAEKEDKMEEMKRRSMSPEKTKKLSPKKSVETENKMEEIKRPKLKKPSDDIKKEKTETQLHTAITKKSFYGKQNSNSSSNKGKSKHTLEDTTSIKTTATIIDEHDLSWTDKYKPKDIKGIIGQQGEKSCMKKLLHWLNKWNENHGRKDKPKLVRPSPWAKNDDGSYFKCALLSGPPGIGKTTTANLVAKELGFDIVEFNASDTRNKRLLHQEVSQLLSTSSLADFMKDGSAPTKKHVLLMDEVDGMAGNEDRGGVQELIQLIKTTNVPIICMCNDRNNAKIRSLVNYCFDLRFSRPRLEQIRGAMMSVCFREKLKMTADALSQIISGTGMDVRQTLNHLSMWTVNNKSLSADEAQKEANAAKKDTILGPWEVVRKVFSAEEHKTMTTTDKFKLFFYDYSIGPLFVQENYLQVQPHCPKKDILKRAADTADSISRSDIVDKKIRSCNTWSLLEVQAIYSSVLPGHYMAGHIKGQINFPHWLGKNSKKGKFRRLVSELQAHTRLSTTGSRKSVNLDYVYHLRNSIIRPLIKEGIDGIEKSINVMRSYNLIREDLDSLIEVSHWARAKDPMSMVDSKVKSAFTRAYNKDGAKLPYAASSVAVKRKNSNITLDDGQYDEEEIDSSIEEDDIAKDAMIKEKKKPSKTKNDTKASTSKKTGNGVRGKVSKKMK